MNSTSILNTDCYIYRVYNTINTKSYIGLTTDRIEKRWKKHLNKAQQGYKQILYNSIRKYGKDNFKIELVEALSGATLQELCDKEVFYIKKFNTFYLTGFGYNMTLGGEGTFGIKLSQEVRDRMSSSKIGKKRKPFTEEHKKNIGIASAKKVFTDEYRKKISNATSGENNPMYGKKQTDESKKKMSLTKDKNSIPFFIKSPSGDIHEVRNVTKFCGENNLTPTHVIRLRQKKCKSHKNWTLYDKC